MCGITSYIGRQDARGVLLTSLKRLEYRGYDSCGITLIKDKKIFFYKNKGRVEQLLKVVPQKGISFHLGIAHTRWATHGRPSRVNAHPHSDCQRKIFVVHNGIIENFQELKKKLLKEGHRFRSQTDTEVIPHLIEKFYRRDLLEAVFKTLNLLKGSFALSIISTFEPDKIIGVRFFSPLILGLKDGERFLASDLPAILPFTSKVVYLREERVVLLRREEIKIFDFAGKPSKFKIDKTDLRPREAEKQGFKHFMLKEIYEQPEVLKSLFPLYVKEKKIYLNNLDESLLRRIERILIVACGTAYHAGLVGRYFLERFARIKVQVEISSEFRYSPLSLDKKRDLFISISQSGETADTLASLREVKKKGLRTLGICNVPGSSIFRESDFLIPTNAGQEIGVASTKAYTAQIGVLFLLSLYLGSIKGYMSRGEIEEHLKEFRQIPHSQERILDYAEKIKGIAKKFSRFGCFLFLGRGINYPSALEGALKLKEISYIPAEGYPAGEMKHGPIALIDEYRAVVCINPLSTLYSKMLSNMQEIKARRGKIIGIVTEGDRDSLSLCDEKIFIPGAKEALSPLLVALPLQLFAYYVADNLGYDVDKPRNLAKSVTVE